MSIHQVPLLTLGAPAGDPDEEFYRVWRPFMLPGSRVAVPMTGAGQIRVFGLDGELLATYGRGGAGPGEFRSLNGAWPRGDTIEAFDHRSMRITRFFPDGTFETVRLTATGRGLPGILSALPGVFGDGWALSGVTSAALVGRDELSVFRFSRDGALVGRVASVEGFYRYQTPGFHGPAPLSPRPQVATRGDSLYLGETLTPSIRVLDGAGHILKEITWAPGRQSAPEAMSEVIRLAVQKAASGRKAQVRGRLEAAPDPERVPAFSAMLVDDEGFVWVRPYEIARDAYALGGPLDVAVSGPGGLWWIFTGAGERIGSLEVPRGLELCHITADVVVGVRRDKRDIEYVQVHRLDPK